MENTETMSHEEVWDDTLLIQHYDSTMDQLKKQVSLKIRSETNDESQESKDDHAVTASALPSDASPTAAHRTKKRKKTKKKNKKKDEWFVGDPCRVVYVHDGQLYEATVTQLLDKKATVTFVGYEETTTLPINRLYKSKGNVARAEQEQEAVDYFDEYDYDEDEEGEGEDDEEEYHDADYKDDDSATSRDKHNNNNKQQQPSVSAPNGRMSNTSSRCGGTAGVAGRWRPVSPEYSSDNCPPKEDKRTRSPHQPQRAAPRFGSRQPPFIVPPPPFAAAAPPAPPPPPHHHHHHRHQMGYSHTPPPMPPSLDGLTMPGDSSGEMLHTMLMSWYMTGYHTGYYKGFNAAKRRRGSSPEPPPRFASYKGGLPPPPGAERKMRYH